MKEYSANSNAAIDQADAAGTAASTVLLDDEQFAHVSLDLIVASLTNRKTFDEAELQGLTDSIKSQGVLEPILLRPLPGARLAELEFVSDYSHKVLDAWSHRAGKPPRPIYEIVCGERRWRASARADRPTVPAVIRPMTDAQAQEAQLIENLQREKLHELDEAEGYRRLCDEHGMTKEDIVRSIGKGRTYVFQRLRLLTLGQEAREAFRDGEVDASTALLLAGVPDPKLQLKALKKAVERDYNGRTLTVRQFADWIEQNIMLKLKGAPFDTKDATLDEAAGVCAGCPKRTGVDRDIFAAYDSPDLCTDPKCYGHKASVSLQRIKDAAEKKGMTVIAGVEAKKLKPHNYNDEIKGYTRLDTEIEGGGTVAKLLGKDAPAPVLFVDPHTRKQIKVLPTATVGTLLKDKGFAVKDRRAESDARRKQDEAALKRKVEYETTWRARVAVAIDEQVRKGAITAFSGPVLRILCEQLLERRGRYGRDVSTLLSLWGLPASQGDQWEAQREDVESLQRHIQGAADTDLGRMVLHLMIADELNGEDAAYGRNASGSSALALLALEAGVDVEATQRLVKKEQKEDAKAAANVKADEKADKAARGAKASPPGANEPAAPAAGRAAGKKASGRAARVSAEEAKSGIAVAMQNIDASQANDFAVGQLVRFKVDIKGTGKRLSKVRGHEGTITQRCGDRAWYVSHGTTAGNVLTADYTEIEHVDGAADMDHGNGMQAQVTATEGAPA